MEILGIDIGGTGVKGAIVNTSEGRLTTPRHRIPTPKPATPTAITKTVAELLNHFQWVGPVGCGFPAAVLNNVAKTASNVHKDWIETNIKAKFESLCPKSEFTVLNDADAAGLAEMRLGAGKGKQGAVIIVTIGTGIGSALFVNGILVPNTELGFLRMADATFAEHYAADSVRRKLDLDWKDWGKRINKYFHRLEKLFYPELIIVGGGISKKFHKFESIIDVKTPLVPAMLRNHAGIIGAALAAEKVHSA